MIIIPAIDLKGGQCVRLLQGEDDRTTVYGNDPVAVARRWHAEGGKRLHIVNLDGAFGRESKNLDVLRLIAKEIPAPIEFGGGLRSLEAMRDARFAGASMLVLGTIAMEKPELLKEAIAEFGAAGIIVAIDSRQGKVVTRGWTTATGVSVRDAAENLRAAGVEEVLHTDVARDGMMGGPDLATLASLSSTGLRVIASGGVSRLEDITAIKAVDRGHISGIIIGKALYEKAIALPEANRLLGEATSLGPSPHPPPSTREGERGGGS
jgi:phosphoribosylformimino-5-aminoimidazole carboxamide ribotide isomerase